MNAAVQAEKDVEEAMLKGRQILKVTLTPSAVDVYASMGAAIGDVADYCTDFLDRNLVVRPSKRQITCFLVIAFAVLLGTGAAAITERLVRRPVEAQAATVAAASMGREIVASMPQVNRESWGELVAEDPALALQVCSVKLRPRERRR